MRRWCEALGTTDEALLKAVQKVGTRVDRIKAYLGAGGNVLGEPMEIPGVGKYVSFMDSEGNRVSMLQPLPRQG